MRTTHSGIRAPETKYDTVYMRGGWDLSTPTLEMYPGILRDVQNFEVSAVIAGGYTRIGGYERFSGQTSPSSVTFTLLQLNTFTNIPIVGQVLTGFTSAAIANIILVASSYLIVRVITGSFLNTEVIKVGATVIGTLVPVTTMLTSLLTAQYTALAADDMRATISAVPGTGAVRGVVGHIVGGVDVVYAFRNNAGGTSVDIYKSSGAGWVNVPLYKEISFTNAGVAVPTEGSTLTQGGVTATIKRIMLQSGSYASGVNTGRFIITAPAGGNFAGGAATAGAVACTLSGIQTAITITVGGTYEFDLGNFQGQAFTTRIYGCDGVNRGFEFDGDVYAPITTGTAPDAPTHVRVHKQHLFFAFGSSVIHSGIGFPYKWTATDGASEIGCGDTVTNFLNQPGTTTTGAIGITTASNVLLLYGVSLATWNLTSFNTGVGGIPFTGQLLNESYWLSSSGVIDLRTTLNYGNFKQATITNNITSYIESQRSKVAYSVVNHTSNQYRILFNDGSALISTVVNGKVAGITKALYSDVMFCAWTSVSTAKNERVFYGASTSGHVYQADKGSSFDGAAIDAFLVFNWNAMRMPRVLKRYRRVSIEMQSSFYAAFSFGYALAYGSTGVMQPSVVNYESGFSGVPFWDSFIWDAFTWDGSTLHPTDVRVVGTAENIQSTVRSTTNYIYPFTVNSMIYHYTPRRGIR